MNAAILDPRPAAVPDTVAAARSNRGASDLVRLFGLGRFVVADPGRARPDNDRPGSDRNRLVCRWRRGADGRLAAIWEPDIAPVPPLKSIAA